MTEYASSENLPPMPDFAADDAYEAELNAKQAFHNDVTEALHRMRVQQAAKELFKAENEPPAPPFDSGTLKEILNRPPEPPMRVEGLMPWLGSMLLVAMRKTGKTTMILNLIRSLLTGDDFLGRFAVQPVAGTIAILNYEVSAGMIARWAHEHSIDQERLYIVNLRGRRNPLTHPEDRAKLAKDLSSRSVETLVVDPFGRAYPGKSQNDPGEVGAFLVDLDLFARGEVGATDLILTAHAGWVAERSRGSSALEDWADSIITLTRDPEDDTQRFLSAMGRDVEIEEDHLIFHAPSRTLRLAGTGSRKKTNDDRKMAELMVFVVRAAYLSPGISVTGIERAIRQMDDPPTFRNGEVSKAAKRARDLGQLTIVSGGAGTKSQHFPTLSQPIPTNPGGVSKPLPPLLIGRGGGLVETEDLPPKKTGEDSTEWEQTTLGQHGKDTA